MALRWESVLVDQRGDPLRPDRATPTLGNLEPKTDFFKSNVETGSLKERMCASMIYV